MSPRSRERAYEKRRYEKWQARLAARQAVRARRRRLVRTVVGALAAILVVAGIVFLVTRGGDGADTTDPGALNPPATSTPDPTTTPTSEGITDGTTTPTTTPTTSPAAS